MVKTFEEFADEIKTLREDIRRNGPHADVRQVASWLDRLVIALEGVAPALDLTAEQADVAASATRAGRIAAAAGASPARRARPAKRAKRRR
jgi:hypothetical protein